MSSVEISSAEGLAGALRERIRLIADRDFYHRDPAGHLAALQAASVRIMTLAASLPRPVDPQLAHYLDRCSFDKALEWLEGRR